MNEQGRTLTRDEIVGLLREVGEILQGMSLEASIYVVGGAAMAMVFDSRRTTRDVDAVIRDHHDEFASAVQKVAGKYGLSPTWVNSSAAAFTPNHADGNAEEMNLPGLRIALASPEHLIAMKLRALRRRDLADLETLFRAVGITSPQQAAAVHDRLFGEADIGYAGEEEALYAAQTVFDYATSQGRPLTDS